MLAGIFLAGISSEAKAQTSNITSVSPDSAMYYETVDVYITGQNTTFNVATSSLRYGSQVIVANSTVITGPATATSQFTIPGGVPVGLWDINVGSDTLYDGFYIGLCNTCATISGSVFTDDNNNCTWDANEAPLSGRIVQLSPLNLYTTTDSTGYYEFSVPPGNYTVTVSTANIGFYRANCPNSSHSYNVTIANSSSVSSGNNFGLEEFTPCPVLNTSMATWAVRPCFATTYTVRVSNVGVVDASGVTVQLDLDPEVSLQSSSIPATSLGNNSYSFNVGSVEAHKHVDFTFSGLASCSAQVGDTACSTVSVTPVDPCQVQYPQYKTTYEYCRRMTNAYDPNEKLVLTPMMATPNYIDSTAVLDYQVSFQNTGTDTAYTVRITDTLSDHLDPATFIPGTSSHSYTYRIYENNIIEWTFANIMLPDSNVNEPMSHGFVLFRIAQDPNNPTGTDIENSAAIFFDFNAPVITNSTLVTVDNTTVSIEDVRDNSAMLKVFPNPASSSVRFVFSEVKNTGYRVEVYDLSGRAVHVSPEVTSASYEMHRGNLAAGMYTFKVYNGAEQVAVGKLMFQD